MSTFGGKIQEIPGISVDRFDGENTKSEVFFLSHCHSDHMVGLNDYYFREMLLEDNKFLYASEVSCVILKQLYPQIENNIKELSVHSDNFIRLKDEYISVVPVSAGHCPGSVMFIFERNRSLILYTGDYRINKTDMKKFKPFYDAQGNLKVFDKIYLDTTFFSRSYFRFPKRSESLGEICKIIEEWIGQGEKYIIYLSVSAKYGYEFVFKEIFNRFKMPVHVDECTYNFCCLIPEMDKAITKTASQTQIHSNCSIGFNQICLLPSEYEIRTIRLSAMKWKDGVNGEISSNEGGSYSVCYSTHASFEEGEELINVLKPKEIEACVDQRDFEQNEKMKQLLQELVGKVNESKVEDRESPRKKDVKLFEIKEEQEASVKTADKFETSDLPPRIKKKNSKDNDFSMDLGLESPPRKKKIFNNNKIDK